MQRDEHAGDSPDTGLIGCVEARFAPIEGANNSIDGANSRLLVGSIIEAFRPQR
jgi:hypothetical protein